MPPAPESAKPRPADGNIDFYFDFSSPYGYLAAAQIEGLAARHGRSVSWHPILLGAVFRTTGERPLAAIPLKGAYATRDLARFARLLDLPFKVPTRFPIAAVAPSRAYYFAAERDTAVAKRFALALFHAYFGEDRDISRPEVTVSVAAEHGMPADVIARALDDELLKTRLRDEVERAVAQGVFGSPYMVVDGEPFWGADRLGQVEEWLRRGGW
jgi:2-hydroxychromene-2-carboxylate isomerase